MDAVDIAAIARPRLGELRAVAHAYVPPETPEITRLGVDEQTRKIARIVGQKLDSVLRDVDGRRLLE